MKPRRLLARAIGAVLVVLLLIVVWRGLEFAKIGVAYTAKTVCSGTFVSKRDAEAVRAEIPVDDLPILQYVGVSVDRKTPSVTASVLGLLTRRAVYREGLGCALELDDLHPPSLPATATAPASALPASRDGYSDDRTSAERSSAALEAVIARAFSEPDPQRLRRTLAVVVTRDGRLIGERYASGIGPDTPLIGWSMTKSVTNALVGILVGQGRLRLDRPVPIPEWQAADDPRSAIALDHLLRMSSGLRVDDDTWSTPPDATKMLLGVGDAAAFAAHRELVAPPATSWKYSNGTSNILLRVVRNTLRDDAAYLSFPRRALFDRIGMSSAVLETDASGTFVGSSFMYATARDWARFGELYLRDGVWDGERILPQGWVAYSTSPAPADPAKRYGAHFWLRIPEEYRGADARLPADTFHAVGRQAQFVTIVPSRNVVIARLGRTRDAAAWDHSAFVRDVLQALDPE